MVVGWSTQEQMIWIYAPWIVAAMQNTQTLWDHSMDFLVYPPMNSELSISVESYVSIVAWFVGNDFMATSWADNPR